MPQAKKLIEVALPLDAINAASAREKSIRHGHPSTLHLWWARRPLAAARAVIFTSVVDDPDDPNAPPAFVEACRRLPGDGPNVSAKGDSPRMRLFDFIERLVTWEATTDEAIMGQARQLIRIATSGEPPPLLDPFAGGGSIPLEAQRLGLEAHASDLNPVAVMINKAMIEIPPRFADMPPVNPRDRAGGTGGAAQWKGAAGLAADVRYYGEWMRERAFERIGHLYPKHNNETVIAWLWARTVISPNPAVNAPVPLVRSFVLSKKKGRECWAKPVIEGTTVRFEVTKGLPPKDQDGTIGKRKFGGGRCIVSGEPISFAYIRSEGKEGRIDVVPMAIVTDGSRGRNFSSFDRTQVICAAEAKNFKYWKPEGMMPRNDPHFPTGYGLYEFAELFTRRQLVALTTFSSLVKEARELATQDALHAGMTDDVLSLREGGRGARAYGETVSVYLTFVVDNVAGRNTRFCGWDAPKSQITHIFGRQAIAMVWDFAESNVFSTSSGSFIGYLGYTLKALSTLPAISHGIAVQADAAQHDDQSIILSTDPPYYDNIGYADLSDFYYVWMRRNLYDIFPDLCATLQVPKAAELIASKYRLGSKDKAYRHFEDGMLRTFINMRRLVANDFPVTVYYAYKQQDAGFSRNDRSSKTESTGWETMLSSLIKAGFSVSGTWPMRTELTGNLKKTVNALASSIVLVCRPRLEDARPTSRGRFLNALRAELPAAIAEMKTGSIAPVDMAQATIGPGMAIYSRYSTVRHADGTGMSVREALAEINRALDEVLEEQDADLDPETRFAVDWFAQYGHQSREFGQADVLARAKGTAVESVALAGVVESAGGKVRIINWREYDPGAYDPSQDKRPTVWEGTHHLIERLNNHGEMGAAALYNRLPGDIADSVRDLAYRLYHICERKGWAEDALDYNTLVSSWSEITRLATSERGQAAQQEMFE